MFWRPSMQTFISPPWRTCSQCHDDPLPLPKQFPGISASRHFGQSSARQLSAPSEGDMSPLGFAQNPAARRGHSFVLACALVSMVASLYARRGRALSGAEVDRIAECHTVRWRYPFARLLLYWVRCWCPSACSQARLTGGPPALHQYARQGPGTSARPDHLSQLSTLKHAHVFAAYQPRAVYPYPPPSIRS